MNFLVQAFSRSGSGHSKYYWMKENWIVFNAIIHIMTSWSIFKWIGLEMGEKMLVRLFWLKSNSLGKYCKSLQFGLFLSNGKDAISKTVVIEASTIPLGIPIFKNFQFGLLGAVSCGTKNGQFCWFCSIKVSRFNFRPFSLLCLVNTSVWIEKSEWIFFYGKKTWTFQISHSF